jgi:hypothetical protein
MKIDFKKIVCFGLVASFGCLSAQEELIDSSKEVAMTQSEGKCRSNECSERMPECPRRDDWDDYDVYTVGECEREETPCKKRCVKERKCKKSDCGSTCKRKGAAKEAQECD